MAAERDLLLGYSSCEDLFLSQAARIVNVQIGIGKRPTCNGLGAQGQIILFATAIGGRFHGKEQAQADAESSPETSGP